MVCDDNRFLVASISEHVEDIALRFVKQIDRILRKESQTVRLLDQHKVIHILPGILHLEEVLTKEISPEHCPDKNDTIDLYRFVFLKMNVLGE